MNKQLIILTLLLALATSQTYSITSCTCAQLLSEGDCAKNTQLGCSWDATKKSCAVSTTPVTPTVTYAAYCDTFAEADCPKAKPCTDCGTFAACAWVDKKCTFFTGCTAFAKTLDSDCQAISNRCITDGTHCVEIDACSTYKKQLPCVKNVAGSLCCIDANTCDKLPITFATDKECRDQISTCTTKTGGGCVDSGNNCSDQTLEIQCVWNKLRSMACYWDGAACKDRICDNAPTTLQTDETCKSFRTDGTCTTKANGGCVTRTTCAAATIGGDCYWTGTACVDKTCTNAPTTMTTNSACGGFVTGCITKSGGGCVANGACSAVLELIVFGIQLAKKRLVPMHQQQITLMNYVRHIYQPVQLKQEVDANLELVQTLLQQQQLMMHVKPTCQEAIVLQRLEVDVQQILHVLQQPSKLLVQKINQGLLVSMILQVQAVRIKFVLMLHHLIPPMINVLHFYQLAQQIPQTQVVQRKHVITPLHKLFVIKIQIIKFVFGRENVIKKNVFQPHQQQQLMQIV